MKKALLLLILVFGTTIANAQKLAYIDSDYILENVPEYEEAKVKLDNLAERWLSDIDAQYELLNTKKENFVREEVLLPAEEKEKRKEEIENLETEVLELQKMRFRGWLMRRFPK